MTERKSYDPIEEFIGQQLHSISNIDAGMMPKKIVGKNSNKHWRTWQYPNHKSSKSFNSGSLEDRLIGSIDKKYRKSQKSRQEEVIELLGDGYKKKEAAEILKVHPNTITADIKRMRLVWERSKK